MMIDKAKAQTILGSCQTDNTVRFLFLLNLMLGGVVAYTYDWKVASFVLFFTLAQLAILFSATLLIQELADYALSLIEVGETYDFIQEVKKTMAEKPEDK